MKGIYLPSVLSSTMRVLSFERKTFMPFDPIAGLKLQRAVKSEAVVDVVIFIGF